MPPEIELCWNLQFNNGLQVRLWARDPGGDDSDWKTAIILIIVMVISSVLIVLLIYLYERRRTRVNAKPRAVCLTAVRCAEYRAEEAAVCDYKEGGEKECEICCKEYADGDHLVVLLCSHSFHEECIKEWLRVGIKGTCPICRVPV